MESTQAMRAAVALDEAEDAADAHPEVVAPSRRMPGGAYTAGFATSLGELRALEAEWLDLERRADRSAGLFQNFAWCLAWAETYAAEGQAWKPFVVTVRRAGRLVLLAPLMLNAGPVRTLRWLTEPFGQYGDVILDPSADARAALEAAWAMIRRRSGADVVRLRHVRADAAAAAFLEEAARRSDHVETAPYLDLSAYPDESAYEQRYSRVQRRRRRRIRQTLEQTGAVTFGLIGHAEKSRHIGEAVSDKQEWLGERGLLSVPVNCPELATFLRRLVELDHAGLELVISVLDVGGQTVAREIGFRYRGRHCGFLTAHDPGLTDASPARLHMDLSQRRAIADGLRLFDLMVPGDPHKQSWSSGSVEVYDYHAALTARGAIYGALYLGTLRPLARRLYLRTPRALRRSLTRMALVFC